MLNSLSLSLQHKFHIAQFEMGMRIQSAVTVAPFALPCALIYLQLCANLSMKSYA